MDPEPGHLPNCDRCGAVQTKQGALAFSPPIDGLARKVHLCGKCWVVLFPVDVPGQVRLHKRDPLSILERLLDGTALANLPETDDQVTDMACQLSLIYTSLAMVRDDIVAMRETWGT